MTQYHVPKNLNLCLTYVFCYVHNMTVCYDRVLMINRNEILSNLHSSVPKISSMHIGRGLQTKYTPKPNVHNTALNKDQSHRHSSLQPSIYKYTINAGCVLYDPLSSGKRL